MEAIKRTKKPTNWKQKFAKTHLTIYCVCGCKNRQDRTKVPVMLSHFDERGKSLDGFVLISIIV